MNKCTITVIQLSAKSYFWVLKNGKGEIVASSSLIGSKNKVNKQAMEINTLIQLGFESYTPVVIEERE